MSISINRLDNNGLDELRGRLDADRDSFRHAIAAEFAQANNNNTLSALEMGRLLYINRELGITDKDFAQALAALNVASPSASRRTVYRTAYEFWVQNMDYNQNELAKLNIDSLYHAARLVTYGAIHPETGNLFTAGGALAFARSVSDKDLRAAVGAAKNASGEAAESGLKSVTIQSDAVEGLKAFAERLARITGRPTVSPSAALLFVLEQVNTLPDDSLDYLWREAHGEVSEEEAAEVQTIVLDFEDDEDEKLDEEEEGE